MSLLMERYRAIRREPWFPTATRVRAFVAEPPRAEWTPGDPPAPSPDQVPVGDPAPPLDAPAKEPA